jgi:tetratricopeptide (TPR) repeat protein
MKLCLRGVSPRLLFPVLTAALLAPLLPLPHAKSVLRGELLTGQVAFAQTTSNSPTDQLFDEGQTLLNQGRPEATVAALEKFQQAVSNYRLDKNRLGEGRATNAIGEAYYLLEQYQSAEKAYRQALAAYQQVNPQSEMLLRQWGSTLNNLGALYEVQGQFQNAWDAYSKALTVRRQANDVAGEGTTLNNLAGVYFRLGDNQNAQSHYLAALAIRRKVGDLAGEATTLNNLGFFSRSAGQYHQSQRKDEDTQKWFQTALNYYDQALTIRRQQNDFAGQASTLNNMGAVYLDLSRLETPDQNKPLLTNAEKAYKAALDIYTARKDRKGQATILNNLGGLFLSQERLEEAKANYEKARDIIRKDGSPEEATTLSNLGFLYRSYGDRWNQRDLAKATPAQKDEALKNAQTYYKDALQSYQSALVLIRQLKDRASEGTTLNSIAGLYLALNQYASALETYEMALILYRQGGDRANEANTRHNIGVAYARQGQYLDALKSYEEALRITQTIGDRPTEASILRNIGSAYAKQGNYQKALVSYRKAQNIRKEESDPTGAAAIEQEIKALQERSRNVQ